MERASDVTIDFPLPFKTATALGNFTIILVGYHRPQSPHYLNFPSSMNLSTSLGRVRLIGLMEGWSFVILLFIAMPLKYLADQPAAVRIVDMAHGVLFLILIAAALQAQVKEPNWTFKRTFLVCLGALLPFGPFVVDAKILKPLEKA
jgi:integral membrane protein